MELELEELVNNILNDSISKIHLLNEKEYNLDHILDRMPNNYKNKVKQHIKDNGRWYNIPENYRLKKTLNLVYER